MRIIALFGPTGVGKTALAIEIASELRGRGESPAAVSADAMQIYQGLEV
jgi:tRNA dimethylallyltransferase